MEGNNITDSRLLASRSYYADTLTWCVQKSQPIPTSQQIYYVCTDYRVWLMAILSGVTMVFSGYYFQQFERQKWHSLELLLNGFACLSGFTCEYRPANTGNRFWFFGFLLACSLITIFVSTFVVRIFTSITFEPQTQSTDDILSSYRLAGERFALMKLHQQAAVICFVKVYCVHLNSSHFAIGTRSKTWKHFSNTRIRN